MLTRQEVVNKAVAGLAAQGFEQSISRADLCMYRGPEGRKCAAGHLIADRCYRSGLEGTPANLPEVCFALKASGVDMTRDGDLVCKLQYAHDHAQRPSDMRERLKCVIAEFNLDLPEALR